MHTPSGAEDTDWKAFGSCCLRAAAPDTGLGRPCQLALSNAADSPGMRLRLWHLKLQRAVEGIPALTQRWPEWNKIHPSSIRYISSEGLLCASLGTPWSAKSDMTFHSLGKGRPKKLIS